MKVPSLSEMPEIAAEVMNLCIIVLVAGLAGLGRLLYGDRELTPRSISASLLTSATAAVIIYPILLHWAGGQVSAYITVAAAAIAGTVTDQILRAVRSRAELALGQKRKENDNDRAA